MLCSVVMALYNKEAFVEHALRSVLQQTFQSFEIVVVNDGSTDRSAAVVESLQDARIRLINQPNCGVSRARNTGIAHARGDIILFLDADDWYDRHYMQAVVDMAARHPERAFYATAFRYVLDVRPAEWERPISAPVPMHVVDDFYMKRYRDGFFFCTNSVAIRRDDLQALQPCFPENENMGEDQDLWFRLAERLTLVFCPLPLAAYRVNVQDSLCATVRSPQLLPVYARLEERARSGQIGAQSTSSALLLVADERVSVARYLFSLGQRSAALRELLRGYRVVVKKRWWWSLVMFLFGTPGGLASWEKRRDRRFQSAD